MSARAAWRLESMGFSQVFRYQAGKQDWLAMGLPVEGETADEAEAGDIARSDVPTCRLTDRLETVRERMQSTGSEDCIVVNDENVVLGRIQAEDLAGDSGQTVEAVMDESPRTYRPNKALKDIARYMDKSGARSVLITNSDGQLLGLIYHTDLMAHRNKVTENES